MATVLHHVLQCDRLPYFCTAAGGDVAYTNANTPGQGRRRRFCACSTGYSDLSGLSGYRTAEAHRRFTYARQVSDALNEVGFKA
jgi:hypothetical protein